jgi:DNA-binding CsgD family transcriptional regulator
VPIFRGEHVAGVFGQVSELVEQPHEHPDLPLTPRQAEVLELLERGRSTTQIGEELHLTIETVRNHIRHVLKATGAHSRLEAVAIANARTDRVKRGRKAHTEFERPCKSGYFRGEVCTGVCTARAYPDTFDSACQVP